MRTSIRRAGRTSSPAPAGPSTSPAASGGSSPGTASTNAVPVTASASGAARSSNRPLTVDDVTLAPCVGMVGSRLGAAALLRGVAKAVADEVEAAVDGDTDDVTVDALMYVLADVQDALDVLDGNTAGL